MRSISLATSQPRSLPPSDVTENNDFPSWNRLFAVSSRFFAVSKRGGQRRSLAAAVNKQLRDELAPAPQGQPLHRNPGSRSSTDPLTFLVLLALRIPLLQLTLTPYLHLKRSILQLTQIPVSFLSLRCLRHLLISLRRKLLWASNHFPLVQLVGQMVCVPSTSTISPVSQLTEVAGNIESINIIYQPYIARQCSPLCAPSPIWGHSLFGATLAHCSTMKGAFAQLPLASHCVAWLPRLGVFAWFSLFVQL